MMVANKRHWLEAFDGPSLLEVAVIIDEDWLWELASDTRGTRVLDDPLLAVDLADFIRINDKATLGWFRHHTHEGAQHEHDRKAQRATR